MIEDYIQNHPNSRLVTGIDRHAKFIDIGVWIFFVKDIVVLDVVISLRIITPVVMTLVVVEIKDRHQLHMADPQFLQIVQTD